MTNKLTFKKEHHMTKAVSLKNVEKVKDHITTQNHLTRVRRITSSPLNYIAVGENYPYLIPGQDGALSEFLRASNTLIITLQGIDKREALALRKGNLFCGILAMNGAILFLWQFHDKKGRPVLTLDSPFESRVIQDINLHKIENSKQRLLIEVHIVDSITNKVIGLRALTMPPELTIEFLTKVQEQLSSIDNGEAQMQAWMTQQPNHLISRIKTHQMGS
jgi:hypothetical protein